MANHVVGCLAVLGRGGELAMVFFSSPILPVMQTLIGYTCEGGTRTALGLTTTAQSVPTVFFTTITSLLFSLGVGRAIVIDVKVPAVMMLGIALVLRNPRRGG